MKPELEQLKLDAMGLQIEETTFDLECPVCHGGPHKDKGSFSVSRLAEGLLYNCFRASCGTSGFVPTMASSLDYPLDRKKLYVPKYYERPLYSVPPEIRRRLRRDYLIFDKDIRAGRFRWAPDSGRLYMPVLDFLGREVGAMTKKLEKRRDGEKKAILYHWHEGPKIHHVPGNSWHGPVAVVEDHLSAIRCARYVPSVALLGTHLSGATVKELRAIYRSLLIVLDPDAIASAYKMLRRWSLYFDKCEILTLPNDPKDMTEADLGEKITQCRIV